MSVVIVPSFRNVSATATAERFIHVQINDQTFQMHPGTAGELLHQLETAHNSLLEMEYCPRGITPLGQDETLHFSRASNVF